MAEFDKIVWRLYTYADYDWTFHEEYSKLKDAEEDAARLPRYSEYKIIRVEMTTYKYYKPNKPIYV